MTAIPPFGPLAYEGTVAVPYINRQTDPPSSGAAPNSSFDVPTIWINTVSGKAWILTQNPIGAALWVLIGFTSTGPLLEVTGNDSVVVLPDSNGNINLLGSGSIVTAGSSHTETISLTGLTNHNVLVGSGTATITKVSPSSTAGIPLVSNGASADPSFTTAVVAGGGTGATSAVAYTPICGGTSTTNPFQSVASIGSAGQVLTSNGAGALPSFQTLASGIASVNVQTITSSGTYTPTANCLYAVVQICGGGGGGGGADDTSGTPDSRSAGGGGGGGGYAQKTIFSPTPQTVTIGAGGAGGVGSAIGTAGGTTSFGAIMSATGGAAGDGGGNIVLTPDFYVNNPNAGGVGSGGDVNSYGGYSFYLMIFGGAAGFSIGATGGSSIFGKGGLAPIAGVTFGQNGGNGSGYGAGGGGACTAQATAKTGGNGTAGVCIVTEFIA